MKLWLDFETYCDLDIKKVGSYRYVNHESFHPWCAAYTLEDEETNVCWKKKGDEEELLDLLYAPETKVYAHNAEFEYGVLQALGYDIPLHKFVDTQALAAVFGYPLALGKFGAAMGLPEDAKKSKEGTRLINKLCKPQKKTIKNPSGRWYPHTAPEDFKKLYEYCEQDVVAMRSATNKLPSQVLSRFEQYVWMHTVHQNRCGIRVDVESILNIRQALTLFKQQGEARLQTATGGYVNTAKQVAKMKAFLQKEGLDIPDLSKATVDKYLNMQIPSVCREVLQLRRDLAHSSVAKFDKLQALYDRDDHRVRGNLVYYGCHTGRFAGRGFQVHNLPRAKVANPEKVLNDFNNLTFKDLVAAYPDINQTASALIRPMIMPSERAKLIVADYTSVENVLLHWAAGDTATTEDFRAGLCQYTKYAASRLRIAYEEVTKEQRAQAKPDVLSLGFGGGAGALIRRAAEFSVELSPQEAQERVSFYRKKYKMIPKFWKNVSDKVKEAITSKDPQVLITPTIQLEFRYAGGYLFILLPSGRRLAYPQARLYKSWDIVVKGKTVPMYSDISYMGVVKGQWARVGTHPGKMVENIIQAMARDCLVYGMLCAERVGYKILMSVHDEAVAESITGNHEDFCEYLCLKQKWAESLPLSADGYTAMRYKKD